MKNFWKELEKPFFCLAPLDDVSDVVFREVVTKTYKPDVLFTEFTNVDGLQSMGREALLPRLKFTKVQKPIVAQIWGLNPANFTKTAEELVEMGFDGIDLNMGCPEKTVTKNGACSALINNPILAAEIIKATKEGTQGKIPVSVKTRIGFSEIQTEEWITFLLKQNIDVLTVHGRTRKEMSKVPAHWDEIGKAVEIRDKLGVDTLIIGNGDVINYEDGIKKVGKYGVDGIMIGRGIFKDLWAFSPEEKKPQYDLPRMLDLLLYHARLFDEVFGTSKNFNILKKFFKIYVSGFEGASDLRIQLMETKSLEDVENVVKAYLRDLK